MEKEIPTASAPSPTGSGVTTHCGDAQLGLVPQSLWMYAFTVTQNRNTHDVQ